jgi:hypothetical protein
VFFFPVGKEEKHYYSNTVDKTLTEYNVWYGLQCSLNDQLNSEGYKKIMPNSFGGCALQSYLY